jgi:ribosomal-protein-alanine N-acetyltransferase
MPTARLHLRPLGESDRAEYLRVHDLSRAHFKPWMPAPEPGATPDEEFTRCLEASRREEAAGTGLRRVGVLEDGRIATVVALSQVFRGPFCSCYVGWRTSAEVLGQGLCTESVRALLGIAFAPPPEGLGLHRVQANIIPANAASLRVAEKLGMRREGLALRYLRIDGRWQDHAMFALLADEFGRGRFEPL